MLSSGHPSEITEFYKAFRKEKATMGGSGVSLYEKVHQIIGGVKTNPTELIFESTDGMHFD
ncbi:hypothetical protein DOY81_005080 [Sarcophaga bullata]|nr:hypothetical protein DOY81_005080 [Sarcophaga bullata]